MVDKTVDSLTSATTIAANDLLYLLRSPYGVGDDRKAQADALPTLLNTLSFSFTVDQKFGLDFGATGNYDNMIGGQLAPDLQYSNATKKLYIRSLIVDEEADTSEIAVRRVNGTLAAPTTMLQNELIGVLYFQPWLGQASWGGASPNYARSSQIQGRLTDSAANIAAGKSGGTLEFATTLHGSDVLTARGFFDNAGKFAFLGNSGLDGTKTDLPAQVTVYGPNTLAGSTLALRQDAAPTFGYDLDLETASVGRLDLYRVVSGVRSLVLSILRSSGFVGIGKNNPSVHLDVDGPVRVKSYTVAGVPSASTSGAGAMVHISNPTAGNPRIYSSDGTNWYDGAGTLLS